MVAVGLGDANGEGLKGKGDGAADAMGALSGNVLAVQHDGARNGFDHA